MTSLRERMVDPRGRPLFGSRRAQRGFLDPYRFAVASSGNGLTDTEFANVELLLHFNGTNGATTTTDSSSKAYAVTRVSTTANISTAQSKFGGSSGNFVSGSTDRWTATLASVNLGTMTNWTIEAWVRFNASLNHALVAFGTAGNNLYLNQVSSVMYLGDGSTNTIAVASGMTTGTWYHVAVTKSGTSYRFFVDGVLKQTSTTALSTGAQTACFVGARTGSSVYFVDGYVEDVRLTWNVARYTAAFTPPAAEFGDNAP